jgi:hypothetical protein
MLKRKPSISVRNGLRKLGDDLKRVHHAIALPLPLQATAMVTDWLLWRPGCRQHAVTQA